MTTTKTDSGRLGPVTVASYAAGYVELGDIGIYWDLGLGTTLGVSCNPDIRMPLNPGPGRGRPPGYLLKVRPPKSRPGSAALATEGPSPVVKGTRIQTRHARL